ncbi:unannotated protein [freshwater metagenome]|uniref:Unannotated protein n=1 Tax=freshwater metagenome TaxID=449393 RepID=A0A6J6BMS8_9ZZZZ
MYDATNSVVFVKLSARSDDECVGPGGCANRTNRSDVPFDRWFRETRYLGGGEFGDRLANEVSRFTPTASERERNVVFGDSRLFCDLGGGLAGHLLGVY